MLSENCEKRLLASKCLSVRPSVRMEQFGSHRMDFHEILFLGIFRKSVDEVQVSLKSAINKGCFIRIPMHIYDRISLTSYNEKCFTQVVQKIKTHVSCSILFFYLTVSEIMWKNIAGHR